MTPLRSKEKRASWRFSNDGILFSPSLRSACDCRQHTSREGSIERVKSSLARASIPRLGGQIDGIYSQATFGRPVAQLNCFEIKRHLYRKNHLQESVAVMNTTTMQESRQSQPGDPKDVSDFMDEEVRVCDTCGAIGFEDCLAICNKCNDGAEHIYCMRVKLDKVPEGDWTCQECMPTAGTNKLVQDEFEEAARKSRGHLTESIRSSKLKSRSSNARKSGAKGASSTSHLSAERQGTPLESQSVKRARAIGSSVVPTRSSEPCNNSLLSMDFSCEKFERVKIKSVNDIISSLPQSSCNSQETTRFPHACADKRHVSTVECESEEKGKALETRFISPNPSKSLVKKLGKAKLEAASSVTPLKESSYGTKEKAKLPDCLGDESPKLDSQNEIVHDKCSSLKSKSSRAADLKSKGQLAEYDCLQKQKVKRNHASHDDRKREDPRTMSKSMSFNSVQSGKSNARCSEVLLANAYEIRNPAMLSLASDLGTAEEKSGKETISTGETFLSGSICCNVDAVESFGQLDCRLHPSNLNTHKDPNCPKQKKKIESCEAEHHIKAATTELCAGLTFDERSHLRNLSQDEEAILSQDLVAPRPHYAWRGKFQIHSNEGIASTSDEIQAHLSTCASLKVLEVVDRLPGTIILEELPHLKMWSSQIMGSQGNEKNIALYFFAKDLDSYKAYHRKLMDYMTKNDLALRGNLDGVELFIFPSNILPEKSQRWNEMLFLLGVFTGRKVNNSADTPVSNSLELENGDTVRAFDPNANLKDGDDMARVDEIPKLDHIGTRPSVGRTLRVGECSNAKGGEEKQPEGVAIVVDLSLWSLSETPKDGSKLGVHHNVEKPSTTLSLAQPAPSIDDENMDPVDVQAASTLMLLNRGRF